MPADKISPILQTARTVLAMQQFSCYVTLDEVHRSVCAGLGGFVQSYSVRRVLQVLEGAKLVHLLKGNGVRNQYCWTGPGDLQDMQEAAEKRVSTPPAKECVQQIADIRTLPIVIEPVPEGCYEFSVIDPASIKWTGPGTYVSLTPDAPPTPTRRGRSRSRTAEQITQAIADAGGNKDKAATALGMSRSGLYAAISALGITIKGKMGRPKASVQAATPPTPPARRGKWARKPLCTIEQAVDAVRACDGNKKAASEMLNVSEPTLYKYLKLSGVVFERSKRNRRDKRKPAVVGMPQRSRKPAISPPPPPAVIVREKAPPEPPRPARAGEQVNTISDRKSICPTRRLSDLDELRHLTRGMNQDERLIIILYYYENQTMKEIGEQLLFSESRISQMHSDMLQRLRARLTDSGRLAC